MNRSTKKNLSGCLIALLVMFTILIAVAAVYLLSSDNKVKRAEEDRVKQSALCDTVPYITEQPQISLFGFDDQQVSAIRFGILRDNSLICDTLVKCEFDYESKSSAHKTMRIPYEYFLKTDTIVAVINNNLYYYISGYRHRAYLHYGMSGYLGSSDCRLSENCTVNGRQYENTGYLSKYEGWKNPAKRPVRIYKDTPEFTAFESRMPLKYQDAYNLYVKTRHHTSPLFLYCHNGYYIFAEEKNDGSPKGIYNIYKINAKTGEIIAAIDFPHAE